MQRKRINRINEEDSDLFRNLVGEQSWELSIEQNGRRSPTMELGFTILTERSDGFRVVVGLWADTLCAVGMFEGLFEADQDTTPPEIAVDEKTTNVDGRSEWLFAAIDTTNKLFHVCLFQTQTTERTLLFLRGLNAKSPLNYMMYIIYYNYILRLFRSLSRSEHQC